MSKKIIKGSVYKYSDRSYLLVNTHVYPHNLSKESGVLSIRLKI